MSKWWIVLFVVSPACIPSTHCDPSGTGILITVPGGRQSIGCYEVTGNCTANGFGCEPTPLGACDGSVCACSIGITVPPIDNGDACHIMVSSTTGQVFRQDVTFKIGGVECALVTLNDPAQSTIIVDFADAGAPLGGTTDAGVCGDGSMPVPRQPVIQARNGDRSWMVRRLGVVLRCWRPRPSERVVVDRADVWPSMSPARRLDLYHHRYGFVPVGLAPTSNEAVGCPRDGIFAAHRPSVRRGASGIR